MKFARVFSVLLAAGSLAVAGIALPAAHAADPGGPVFGKFVAYAAYEAGWCATDCLNSNGEIGESDAGAPLSAPGFYKVTVNRDTKEFKVTSDTVEAGEYKLVVWGAPYSTGGATGYLKLMRDNVYSITRDFSAASSFTVHEGTALNLGTLNLQTMGAGNSKMSASDTFFVYGGSEVHNKLRASNIPDAGKVVVRSFGCGTVRTRRVIDRAGDYSYTYVDKSANRHYRHTLRLKAVLVQPGFKNKVLFDRDWNVSRLNWRCLD